jgi:hypothetical protein
MDIICKKCKITILATFDSNDRDPTIEEQHILDTIQSVPCSKCIPVDAYVEQCLRDFTCT